MAYTLEEQVEGLHRAVRVVLHTLAEIQPQAIEAAKDALQDRQKLEQIRALDFALSLFPNLPPPPFGLKWLRDVWK